VSDKHDQLPQIKLHLETQKAIHLARKSSNEAGIMSLSMFCNLLIREGALARVANPQIKQTNKPKP
jgi:hypothetical protein